MIDVWAGAIVARSTAFTCLVIDIAGKCARVCEHACGVLRSAHGR